MTLDTQLMSRRDSAIPRGVATAFPIFVQRAAGAELWDIHGTRYIDFAGGIGVLNTGHRHPAVLDAVRNQLDAFIHTAFQVIAYEPYIALCERLNALAPFKGPAKTILFSTGAECVENAVKIARAATQAWCHCFFGWLPRAHGSDYGPHREGRTLQTAVRAGASGHLSPALPNGSPRQHHPDPGSARAVVPQRRCANELAAIIIEPVQGEGGFLPAPHELLRNCARSATNTASY